MALGLSTFRIITYVLLRNEQWIFPKVVKISDFRILSDKIEPALSKSDSAWVNSYCVRLVIVSLAMNISCNPSSVKITFFVKCVTISAAISCYAMLKFL